jgi:hypothetical protein
VKRLLLCLCAAMSLTLAVVWARSFGGIERATLTVGGATYSLSAWRGALRASRTTYATGALSLGPPFITITGPRTPPPPGLAYARAPHPDRLEELAWEADRPRFEVNEYQRAHAIGSEAARVEQTWYCSAPCWAGLAAAAVPPGVLLAARVASVRQRRRRVRMGVCPTCGYDLRATSGRCPECGAKVPTRSTEVIAERPVTRHHRPGVPGGVRLGRSHGNCLLVGCGAPREPVPAVGRGSGDTGRRSRGGRRRVGRGDLGPPPRLRAGRRPVRPLRLRPDNERERAVPGVRGQGPARSRRGTPRVICST